MVLVAHNVVSCMDDQVPASISLPVHNILRNELGFDGVIITDDLVMEGVRQFAGDCGRLPKGGTGGKRYAVLHRF